MLLTARPAVLFSVKCPTLHLREKHIDTLGTSLIGTDSFSSEVDQSEQQSLMLWGLDLRVGCRRRQLQIVRILSSPILLEGVHPKVRARLFSQYPLSVSAISRLEQLITSIHV